MSSTNTIINPKPCNYQCGTRIYWNTSENAYYEVFSGKKHICPNRSSSNNKKPMSLPIGTDTTTNTNRQSFYSKKSWSPKLKMSNSVELLSGPIDSIQKKYEILSDIVTEANGKVHGSQSHIIGPGNNIISLIVYYEVPEGKREEVKQKFNNNNFIYNTKQNYR